jgi:perosamine synthetase
VVQRYRQPGAVQIEPVRDLIMIPLAVPNLIGREAEYLRQCVETGFVSTVGPFVSRFEGMVAAAAGCAHAIATSAGTTGLHAALVSVGVGHNDLVVLPSLTFIASANAIAHCGAMPWLLDVTESSWTLDPEMVTRVLAEDTYRCDDGAVIHRTSGRRVAAIMPVHTLGLPADMDPIVAAARAHGLPVVVDSASALGATYRDRPVGQLGADLSVFSFNGNKTITAGGGGAVAGNDADLCARVRHLTTTARVGSDYDHDQVGFNYRMTNLQAAVGCAQMENLEHFVARKRAIRDRYEAAFANLSGIRAFPTTDWADGACWFSGFIMTEGDAAELHRRLRAEGIDARPFWKPMHLQAPYRDAPRTAQTVAENLWGRVITLPCSTGITEIELDQVITSVRNLLS